ncbi:hypothetical protein BRADI_4g00777v3 [Brachypodium distachyon]|uniref:Uncharacterized protein n=1 Tax=Brachypodium distachyon TaxID=15368 RepID=A0A2K2CJT1_BRADI|nr:hypothetical protein BRADI_4g00777v3 [Brachypodium distachyon]
MRSRGAKRQTEEELYKRQTLPELQLSVFWFSGVTKPDFVAVLLSDGPSQCRLETETARSIVHFLERSRGADVKGKVRAELIMMENKGLISLNKFSTSFYKQDRNRIHLLIFPRTAVPDEIISKLIRNTLRIQQQLYCIRPCVRVYGACVC